MTNLTRRLLLTASLLLTMAFNAVSQVTVSGSVQSDILFPQDDDKIGTEHSDDKVLTNTYVDLKLGSKYVEEAPFSIAQGDSSIRCRGMNLTSRDGVCHISM